MVDLVGVDFVPCPLPFWLTINCSPLDNPRLEMGSSGINVKPLGGYPVFTEKRVKVSQAPMNLRWLAYYPVVRAGFP